MDELVNWEEGGKRRDWTTVNLSFILRLQLTPSSTVCGKNLFKSLDIIRFGDDRISTESLKVLVHDQQMDLLVVLYQFVSLISYIWVCLEVDWDSFQVVLILFSLHQGLSDSFHSDPDKSNQGPVQTTWIQPDCDKMLSWLTNFRCLARIWTLGTMTGSGSVTYSKNGDVATAPWLQV